MAEIVKKVCICGDPHVGKTSLVKRFVTGKYDDKYISTLGTVISKKSIKTSRAKANVTMMLWDISGQHEFRRIHAAAFRNAKAGFAVCDLTRPDTASNIEDWVYNFRKHAGEDKPVTVLANKHDLSEENKEIVNNIQESMKRLGVSFYLTSAKTGENVEEAFTQMANSLVSGGAKKPSGSEEPQESSKTNGIPDQFENTGELLDYIMMRFCDALGDHEMGMHIVRKQVTKENIDFHNITQSQARKIVDELVPILGEFKGSEMARNLKHELNKACARC